MTPGVLRDKSKGKELQKQKGTENDKNQASKCQRQGKKQSTKPGSDPTPSSSSNSGSRPPLTQADPNVVRIPGVGPSAPNDTSNEDKDVMGSEARDVWVFVRPLDTKEPPPSGKWPKDENAPMLMFPKESKYAGCMLCLL